MIRLLHNNGRTRTWITLRSEYGTCSSLPGTYVKVVEPTESEEFYWFLIKTLVREENKKKATRSLSASTMVVLTANHFNYFAGDILARANRDGRLGRNRDFKSLFGVSANICSVVWNLCDFPRGTKPVHLLWAFLFMKVYGTEPVLIAIVNSGPNKKTFRKWAWNVIEEVAAKAPSVVSCCCFLI